MIQCYSSSNWTYLLHQYFCPLNSTDLLAQISWYQDWLISAIKVICFELPNITFCETIWYIWTITWQPLFFIQTGIENMSAFWNGCHYSRQSVRSGQFRYKTWHAVCTKQQIRYHYNDNRVIFIKHWWFVKWCRKLIFSITGDRPSTSAVRDLI